MTILSFDLQLWPWPSTYLNKCFKWHFYSSGRTTAILFWNPCINVEVMFRTSSIYDHFIIWPSSVTLTVNLPEQMFQRTLLILKENDCAKLFWSPGITVGVMSWTSSIYVTFKCDLDLQPTWKNVSNDTSPPQERQQCQIFLKSMHECRSQGLEKSGCMHTHTPNKNCNSYVSLYHMRAWQKWFYLCLPAYEHHYSIYLCISGLQAQDQI